MNLPNKLTMLRILLIPVFIVFAMPYTNIPHRYLIAGIIFAVASFTDFLDGSIARKRNMVTDFGKFADPLADKILTTTAFIYMLVDGACNPLVIVIIIVREFAVSGVRMIAAGSSDGTVIAANMWGKVKTVLQMVTICVYYFMMAFWEFSATAEPVLAMQIANWLCWAVALVTAISGVQYLWHNRKFFNTAK